MFAYDFPLLSAMWVLLVFFLWIAWIIILFRTIIDIFRSDDMGGGAKAGWLLFVALIPWLGVLCYLVARGGRMVEREAAQAARQEESFKAYVRQVAGTGGGGGGGGVAAELAQLAELRDRGVLSDDEFQAQKARLLA